jgi:hypothetical protein
MLQTPALEVSSMVLYSHVISLLSESKRPEITIRNKTRLSLTWNRPPTKILQVVTTRPRTRVVFYAAIIGKKMGQN